MLGIWYLLDVLMVIALALALIFNLARKREECRHDSNGPVTRRYLDAKVAFFVTAGVTILFLHSWFSLLAFGGDSLEGNHQAWVIWAAVNTLLPLVLGATGYRLWMGGSDS